MAHRRLWRVTVASFPLFLDDAVTPQRTAQKPTRVSPGPCYVAEVVDPGPQAALVRRARAKDAAAFRTLVNDHHTLVFRVAARICGSTADAEDVTQETFVRAWQKLPTLKDEAAFVGWLCAIARHTALDKKRAAKSRPTTFVSEEAQARAIDRLLATTPSGEDEIARKETAAVVRQAVGELPEHYRTALLLKDVDGESAATIAQALGIAIGTVESRATRARDLLRKKLADLAGSRKR